MTQTKAVLMNELKKRLNDQKVFNEIGQKFDFDDQVKVMQNLRKDLRRSNLAPSKLQNNRILDNLERNYSVNLLTETIVERYGRPSLLINGLDFEVPTSATWAERLKKFKKGIQYAIPAIGRIELKNHLQYDWVGTGWLLGKNGVLVTNRHVAALFAHREKEKYVFKIGSRNKQVSSFIDFREEHQVPFESEFKITEIVYISEDEHLDIAICKVSPVNIDSNTLPPGLELEGEPVVEGTLVYTIGYPAWDSRVLDLNLMDSIFRGIYNVKRLAPGKITGNNIESYHYEHDCTTLGGCSGSAVVNLESGKVIGLHFAGRYRHYNLAIKSHHIVKLLHSLKISC